MSIGFTSTGSDTTPGSPLKICLYTTTALPRRGGQELVVDFLAREFIGKGHEVLVLTPGAGRDAKAADKHLPYPVVRHPRFVSTRHLVPWYRWFLLRTFRRYRFNILHCHGVYPAGYLGALCRERLIVPLVITNHAGGLEAKLSEANKPILRERYRHALGTADGLIAVSQMTSEYYRHLCPDTRNVWKIPNGVNVTAFATPTPRPDNLDPTINSSRYLLFLGRLIRKKGADLLLEAFARLPAHEPLVLVVAGSGTEEKILKERAQELALSEKVKFVGWVTGDTKTYLLQNALCCVIPSRGPEAFGLVALESYAAGRPVVAARTAGLSELVLEERTGDLFEPNSIDSLVSTLRHLIQNPSRLAAMATESRQLAASYGWSMIADRHLELYRSLLNGQPSPGNTPTTAAREVGEKR
jgi:glycosyltransferase involved in cell wall biosynthesis